MISKKEGYWSTRQILRAVAAARHEPGYVKTVEVRLVVGDPPEALQEGTSLRDTEGFVPRIGRSMRNFGTMLLRHLEIMGIPTTMSDEALTTARNKLLALRALHEAGVPVPRTVLLASRPSPMEAWSA